jgi:predicted transcriptional regulator of viral defense system
LLRSNYWTIIVAMRSGITGGSRDDLAHLLQRGRRVVSVDDTSRALGLDRREAAKRLAHWASTGWLRRVRRGLYIPVPLEAENPAAWSEDALFLADVVWAPCYFTGWTAANHWGLTEQVFRTIVVKTTQRVRASRQRLLDHEFLLSHVPTDKLWGVHVVWRHDRRIQMADPTRTVVDILDEPALGGGIRHAGDILVAYLAEHDGKELLAYVDRLGNRTVFKRLGYLLDVLAQHRRDLADECRKRLPAGVSLLEPGRPSGGTLSGAWGLRINVRLSPEGAS